MMYKNKLFQIKLFFFETVTYVLLFCMVIDIYIVKTNNYMLTNKRRFYTLQYHWCFNITEPIGNGSCYQYIS